MNAVLQSRNCVHQRSSHLTACPTSLLLQLLRLACSRRHSRGAGPEPPEPPEAEPNPAAALGCPRVAAPRQHTYGHRLGNFIRGSKAGSRRWRDSMLLVTKKQGCFAADTWVWHSLLHPLKTAPVIPVAESTLGSGCLSLENNISRYYHGFYIF